MPCGRVQKCEPVSASVRLYSPESYRTSNHFQAVFSHYPPTERSAPAQAERSITVTARILSGDRSLRMQKVTSLG